jgi:hypothetical protein
LENSTSKDWKKALAASSGVDVKARARQFPAGSFLFEGDTDFTKVPPQEFASMLVTERKREFA